MVALAFGSGYCVHGLADRQPDAIVHGGCLALNTASAYGFLDAEGRRRTLHALAHEYHSLPFASPRTFESVAAECAALPGNE